MVQWRTENPIKGTQTAWTCVPGSSPSHVHSACGTPSQLQPSDPVIRWRMALYQVFKRTHCPIWSMIWEVWPCLMNGGRDNANQSDPGSPPAVAPPASHSLPTGLLFPFLVTQLRFNPRVTKLSLNYIINPNNALARTFRKFIQGCWQIDGQN